MCKGGKREGTEFSRLRWGRRKVKQRGKEQVGRNGKETKSREAGGKGWMTLRKVEK